MRLQNAEHAIIAPEKLRDYLLVAEHPDNQGKARLFAALGYTTSNWQLMERSLREQHLVLDATESRRTEYGVNYEIVGPLTGPLGSATIMSVWTIDYGADIPRFVTARRP